MKLIALGISIGMGLGFAACGGTFGAVFFGIVTVIVYFCDFDKKWGG